MKQFNKFIITLLSILVLSIGYLKAETLADIEKELNNLRESISNLDTSTVKEAITIDKSLQEVTKTVIVPVTTETTTKSAVNTTTESAVQTEVTVLSKVNTTSRSTSSTVTLTQATVSGQAYDATLAENIANKTENDGIAETGEFYYVEIPTQVDSGVVDFVEVTIMTDGVDLIDVEYEVEQVVDITVDAAVETTNIEDVGVAVSQTAPAP